MSIRHVPINKGNYSMESPQREALFEQHKAEGWGKAYREYRENWTKYAENQFVSDYPLLIDLELASVCNLKCPMCYTISPDFRKKVDVKLLDFNLFKKVIDEIGGKVPALRLSLRGEATLHPRFIECIQYAKSSGIQEVSTLTHGGKLTLDFFSQIAQAGIDWITISIDGIKETYDGIRKPLKFEDILRKVKDIHQFKQENGLHKPVIKIQGIWPAIREKPQLYYDAFSPYTDLVAFNPLIDYLGKDNDILYLDEFTCPQQYQRLVIGADGLVMKCSNDEENQDIIGDIKTETVHQVWHGEGMNQVRALHKQKQGFLQSAVCKKCYLPRKTEATEITKIDGREILIMNYVNRVQKIGS